MIDTEMLKKLIDDAEHGKPELPADVLSIEGFTAPKVQRLLNALCSQPDARYLEIGVHIGATLIPAAYGNTAQVTCVDSWQQFAGAREAFKKNLAQFLPYRGIEVHDADCFKVNPSDLSGNYNVYFYDGAHTAEAQYQGIMRYAPLLASRFVLLVDDCNWEEPREETKRALADLGYRVLFDRLLPGAYNGDQAGWWNGLYVGLIEK